MAPKREPGWDVYKEQMAFWCYGDALWQPAPTHNYQRISVGDVGFIRCGQFHLLFSAARPLGERQLGVDVPSTFVELQPDAVATTFSQPRLHGCIHTDTVVEFEAGIGASISAAPPLEPGAYFSYKLTGKRGAALVTRYETYIEDALKRDALEQYTKKHYDSWVAFSREKQYGSDVKPVLVSGVDMTKDFAMAAYSKEGTSLGADFTISVPLLASASASVWGMWHTSGLTHTNYGPQQCTPPSVARIAHTSPEPTNTRTVSEDYNQCVFVRYYTMRKRMGIYPTVIRAAAGPHDLGSGNNRNDTFPELMARQDPTSDHEGGPEGGDKEWDTDAADAGSDEVIVVHNVPHDGEYDEFDIVADYVFQNSSVTSVLMNHQDLAEIRAAGGSGSIPFLLDKIMPEIAAEESGVGRIIFRQNRPLSKPAFTLPHTAPEPEIERYIGGVDKPQEKWTHEEAQNLVKGHTLALTTSTPTPSPLLSTSNSDATSTPVSVPVSAFTPAKKRSASFTLPSFDIRPQAWTFRDDMRFLTSKDNPMPFPLSGDAEITINQTGGSRGTPHSEGGEKEQTPEFPEKRPRKKWTHEETQNLVKGCNKWGVGNWKAILKDPELVFDNRSPVDLKDRSILDPGFRTYFPDAYKQHYPNAKTHLSSRIRSSLPDGKSLFEKTRSKRRPFTEEEDRALRAGYEKYGTLWAQIVKDPIFQEQKRRSTDLRDRFRNAFPDLYEAAGYKPRLTRKKVIVDPVSPLRVVDDDELPLVYPVEPFQRERANSNEGPSRRGTRSVSHSAANSNDENSTDERDNGLPDVRPSGSRKRRVSASPQLGQSLSLGLSNDGSIYGGGDLPPAPSESPFSLHALSHGVFDRYDLIPTSFPHDISGEVGFGDTHSAFSDPEMFTTNFGGFTHHSNYAGDLIFGTRSHQPQQHFEYGVGGSVSGSFERALNPHSLQVPGGHSQEIDDIGLNALTLQYSSVDLGRDMNLEGALSLHEDDSPDRAPE